MESIDHEKKRSLSHKPPIPVEKKINKLQDHSKITLLDPEIAAEANALYFLQGLTNPIIVKKYGNKDPNDFRDFTTALKAAVNANAGAGADISRGFAKVSYDAAVAASNKYNFDTTSTTA